MGRLSGFYYGWWLVVICLLLNAIGSGLSIYIVSLIASALEQEFGSSRALIMFAVTGHTLFSGLLAPILSRWMDSVSIRKLLIITALIAGMGFVVIAATPNIWGFVGAFILLLPAGITLMTALCPTILLSRWFIKYRGTAIGIAGLGAQLGGFIFPPLTAVLFAQIGWRLTLMSLGLVLMVLVPLMAYLWVQDHPRDRGLHPDGGKSDLPLAEVPADADSHLEPLVHSSLWSRQFWMLSIALALLISVFIAILSNLALFAIDIGVTRERAALLISIYALVGMIASPILGRLCDVIDVRLVLAGVLVICMGSVLLFASGSSYPGLVLASAIIAIGGGGVMPLWGSLIGKLFDPRIYARMFGLSSLVILTASAMAPLLSGWLFDLTQSYRLMFLVMCGALAIPLLYTPLLKCSAPDDNKTRPA